MMQRALSSCARTSRAIRAVSSSGRRVAVIYGSFCKHRESQTDADVIARALAAEGLEVSEVAESVFFVEEPQGRHGRRTGERVAGEGVSVEELFVRLWRAEEGLVDVLCGERSSEREVASAEAFREAQQVG